MPLRESFHQDRALVVEVALARRACDLLLLTQRSLGLVAHRFPLPSLSRVALRDALLADDDPRAGLHDVLAEGTVLEVFDVDDRERRAGGQRGRCGSRYSYRCRLGGEFVARLESGLRNVGRAPEEPENRGNRRKADTFSSSSVIATYRRLATEPGACNDAAPTDKKRRPELAVLGSHSVSSQRVARPQRRKRRFYEHPVARTVSRC